MAGSGLGRGTTTRARGAQAEAVAQAHLEAAGLTLVARNVKSPGRGGGEVDLIMREPNGTLVFVEVRQRRSDRFGGAAASVGWVKQRRIVFAARHYLARLRTLPPCRFDVVALGPTEPNGTEALQWIRGAFDASGY